MIEVPLEMILQPALNPSQSILNVLQVVLPHPAHPPPDEEESRQDEDANDIQDDLEVVHVKTAIP